MEENRVFGSRSDCSYVNPPEPKDKDIYIMKKVIKSIYGDDFDFSKLSEEEIKSYYNKIPVSFKKDYSNNNYYTSFYADDKYSSTIDSTEQLEMLQVDEQIDEKSGYYDWVDLYAGSDYEEYKNDPEYYEYDNYPISEDANDESVYKDYDDYSFYEE